MKINIGDYVRTKKGIAKIIGKRDDMRLVYPNAWVTDTYLEINDDTEYIYEEDIIKNRSNIIDLLEVGDILKLKNNKEYQQVECIKENELYLTGYIQFELRKSKAELQEEIEWVITHEQIESMKYEVR